MTFRLGARSRKHLLGVHPDLVQVVERAIEITPIDFTVIEGIRTAERQRQLVKAGASKTLKSRHLTGHAVDLAAFVGGSIRWDWPLYERLADHVLMAADDVGVTVEWGGHWTFKDGPHYQLPWKDYP